MNMQHIFKFLPYVSDAHALMTMCSTQVAVKLH